MFTLEYDPITGDEMYRSSMTGEVSHRKPLILGSERWDPDDMLLWDVEEVRGTYKTGESTQHHRTHERHMYESTTVRKRSSEWTGAMHGYISILTCHLYREKT